MNLFSRYTVAASSMGYSIVLCTLLSVLCYSLLLVTGYQEVHKIQLKTRNELVHTLVQAETYYLRQLEGGDDLTRPTDVLDNGIRSHGKRFSWGGYEVLTTSAWFKEDTLSRSLLVGQQQQQVPLALYLTDRGKPLQLSGGAQIKGQKYLPNKYLKPAYLTGSKSANIKKSTGTIKKSNARLPVSPIETRNFDVKGRIQMIENSEGQRLYHPFSSENPIEIRVKNKVEHMDVSGFVIMSSRDSLYIDQSAQLNDILIKAPVVTLGKGFKGTVQIYATEAVYLEEEVTLAYPSSIYLESKVAAPKIMLANGSKVIGGLAFTNTTNTFMPDGIVQMDPSSLVVGGIYCKGKLGLEGKVIGTVYTEQFYLKTDSGRYDNYILDGIIDSGALPQGFIRPAIFPSTTKNTTWDAVKGV